jgi:hypothetical protein
MVPVLADPVFGATLKRTVPLPLPLAGSPSAIHDALVVAVQTHVAEVAVIANEPLAPVSTTVWLVGEIVKLHGGGAAACMTVRVRPAMATVPVRAAAVLAATVTLTLPLPVPAGRSIEIHAALDAAVHAQLCADAVTATGPVPPVSGTLWLVGAIENAHAGGAAA